MSELLGKQTINQRKYSRSEKSGNIYGSLTESISEVSRPLLTPDECMRLPTAKKEGRKILEPAHLVTLVTGSNPIYGKQYLFFLDKDMLAKTQMPPIEPGPLKLIRKADDDHSAFTVEVSDQFTPYAELTPKNKTVPKVSAETTTSKEQG